MLIKFAVSRATVLRRFCLGFFVLISPCWADPQAQSDTAQTTTGAVAQPGWLSPSYWFDPATAPFLPVPEIATDPDSGTTVGLLAVKLGLDQDGDIRRIIAPDFLY